MKKLALVLAIALIAAFYVTPVIASDFSAGGTYRFEAVSKDPGEAEKSDYFDQRMRVAFNWKVNDNVSAQIRTDISEAAWGDGYRPEQGTDTLMVDRAWVKINQGPLTLTVGQQYGMFGLEGTLWGDQFQGIQAAVDLKPFTLTLVYVKESEGGTDGNVLTDDGANDDTDTYGVSVGYAGDAFSGGLSFATTVNGADDTDLSGLGLHFSIPVANFAINGEANTYFGDDGAGADYAGTQFWVALDGKFSDSWSGGVTAIWADDVDAGDTQVTNIVDDANFVMLDWAGALGYNNSPNPSCDIFDVSGNGKGVMGVVGDIKFAASDALTLYAKLGYAEPNESDNLDSKIYALANFDYAWMPAVTFSGGVGYIVPDYNSDANDDALLTLTVQLGVSF
ncbi:porin [Desulfobacula sp.]|uniref:porin n=1 Tax=Desulfobacula sp. TaxID=2593537 RepID=UPI0025BB90FC|nr:porin [Desulfobacula sp.]MBC2703854.1 hypothetical protein [Desulfobacula sp.]